MVELPNHSWIALAGAGPVLGLTAQIADGHLCAVDDPAAFDLLLRTARPLVAILAAPPATQDDEVRVVIERHDHPRLRLVHLTRPDDEERRLSALRRGFDEVLTTAIGREELLVRLRLLEAQARLRPTAGLTVAEGVVLDPLAHEVRRDGERIHLRPKEFRLLAMLAAHPGRAYSRRQLLDRVWGPDHHGDPRTVDVHVRWLRAKIEPAPGSPVHLVTVRGVGYRLDPDGR